MVDLAAPTATPPLPAELIDAASAGRLVPLRTIGLGGLTSAAFMPDGSALVAATSAGLVWYTLPGLAQTRLDPVGIGFQLVIAPQGDRLASTALSTDDTQHSTIRRTADAGIVAEVEGAFPVFSPDGTLVATGTDAYTEPQRSWVWSASDGLPVTELDGGTTVFSPGGAYVATVAISGTAPSMTRVYPARGGAPVLEVAATTPAFSPDDGLVAVTRGGQVEVYALPGGELRLAILTKVEAAASFSADGERLLIVVGPDLWVWDVAANREADRVAGVNRADVVFVPDGPRFGPGAAALASFEPPLGDCPRGGVTIRATDDGRVLFTDDASYAVAFATDGGQAALTTGNGLRVADLASGEATDLPLSGYDAITLSPNGATLAASSVGAEAGGRIQARVELWDLATGERRAELLAALEDFTFSLMRLSFSADGGRVTALASYGCTAFGFWKVTTWDVASGQIVGEITDLPTVTDADGNLSNRLPEPFAIAPDGSAAAWADEDGQIVVRRAAGGEDEVFTAQAAPTALAFTPDGSALLAGDATGGLRYLGLDGAQPVSGSTGSAARELTFSPDGRRVVALLEGGGGALLDAATLAVTTALATPEGAAGASITVDGAIVAAGEPGGFVLYDGTSGARLTMAKGGSTALIGPGRRLVATLEGGRVVLWGAP
jgi:WD40 repeat protein